VDLIIFSSKTNLFSPWFRWKFAELVINNNHSLTGHNYALYLHMYHNSSHRCTIYVIGGADGRVKRTNLDSLPHVFFFIFCVKFLQLKLRFASCKNNYFTIKGQWLWINNNYDLIICQLTNHQSLLSPTSHQINHYKLLNNVDLLHYPIASI
jgi:hypothetical protein